MNLNRKNLIAGLKTIIQAKYFRLFNKPIKPKVIAYSVTWRCNAKCFMCGLANTDNIPKDINQELTTSDIDRIFKDEALNSLDLIRFTGGEPFLKNDLTDIVNSIWKNAKPKLFHITTNGTYTERIRDFISFFNNKDIKLNMQVSLDAANEAHDKIRGLSGLFNKVIYTLEELKKLKENINIPIIIGINQTISRDNIKEIALVNKLTKEFGFGHTVYIAVEGHESKILSRDKRNYELKFASDYSIDDVSKLCEEIEQILEKNRKFEGITDINYLRHLPEKYLLEKLKNHAIKKEPLLSFPCQAAFLYLKLMPNGDIVPCTLMPQSIGNLKTNSFSKIWYSQKADDIRKQVSQCPGCWVGCDIVPSFIYSGYMIKYFLKDVISSKMKWLN